MINFSIGDDLLQAVRYCAKKGLKTRIVTNDFWAKTPATAKRIIKKYINAGLTEINLSCDDYHQEFIPLDRIKFANEVCVGFKLPCLIGHKVMKNCKITPEYLEDYFGCKLTTFIPGSRNQDNNIISTGYTVPVAENMHLIPDNEILYPEISNQWKGPCSSILKHVIITPRKELSICCGMIPRKVKEIFFGPVKNSTDLKKNIVAAHQDLIVNWLALEGQYGMMKFILSKDPDISFRKKYVNICHLCSEILTRDDCRAVLMKYGHEKSFELSMERSLYDFIRTSPQVFLDHTLPGT